MASKACLRDGKWTPQIPCAIGFSWGLGYFARQTKNFQALFLSLTKSKGKGFWRFSTDMIVRAAVQMPWFNRLLRDSNLDLEIYLKQNSCLDWPRTSILFSKLLVKAKLLVHINFRPSLGLEMMVGLIYNVAFLIWERVSISPFEISSTNLPLISKNK